MSLSIVENITSGQASGATVTITFADVQPGDLLVVLINRQFSALPAISSQGTPGGAAWATAREQQPASGANHRYIVEYCIAGSSEPASYTWDTGDGSASASWCAKHFRSPGNISLDGSIGQNDGSSAFPATRTHTHQAGSTLIAMAMINNNVETITDVDEGFAGLITDNNRLCAMAHKYEANAGTPFGGCTFTCTGSFLWGTEILSFRDDVPDPLIQTGLHWNTGNGTSLTVDGASETPWVLPTAGNTLIACLIVQDDTGTITPPAGWNVIGNLDNGANLSSAMAWKTADGTESAITFSWVNSVGRSQLLVYEYDYLGVVLNDAFTDSTSSVVTSLSSGTASDPGSTYTAFTFCSIRTAFNADSGAAFSNGFNAVRLPPNNGNPGHASSILKNTSGTAGLETTFSCTDNGDFMYHRIAIFADPTPGTRIQEAHDFDTSPATSLTVTNTGGAPWLPPTPGRPIIAVLTVQNDAGAITVPAGWTEIENIPSNANLSSSMAWKIADGSEAAVTFTWVNSVGRSACTVYEFAGPFIFNDSNFTNQNNSSQQSINSNTVTDPGEDYFSFAFMAGRISSNLNVGAAFSNGFFADFTPNDNSNPAIGCAYREANGAVGLETTFSCTDNGDFMTHRIINFVFQASNPEITANQTETGEANTATLMRSPAGFSQTTLAVNWSSLDSRSPLSDAFYSGLVAGDICFYNTLTVPDGRTLTVSGTGVFSVDGGILPQDQTAQFYIEDSSDGTTGSISTLTIEEVPPTPGDPPIIGNPTGTETGDKTADGSVDTNTPNGTLYTIASENPVESIATIKAGASQPVTVAGTQNTSYTGLLGGTTYYNHFVHENVDGDSNIAVSSAYQTQFSTAVLSAPTANASNTTLNGSVTTDVGGGTLYYLATESATATPAEIKAGRSRAVTAAGVQNVSWAGLSPNTLYYMHYIQETVADSNQVVASDTTGDLPPASQLNDAILIATGGPTINDGLANFFGKTASESLNDAERRWLIDNGVTPGPLNQMWYELTGNFGYQGALNERLLQFWQSGGIGGISGAPINMLQIAACMQSQGWTVTDISVNSITINTIVDVTITRTQMQSCDFAGIPAPVYNDLLTCVQDQGYCSATPFI